jgi:hypothetical protein
MDFAAIPELRKSFFYDTMVVSACNSRFFSLLTPAITIRDSSRPNRGNSNF